MRTVPRPPPSARGRQAPYVVATLAFLVGFGGQMVELGRHPARAALPAAADVIQEVRRWDGTYVLEAVMDHEGYLAWADELGLERVPEAERSGDGVEHAGLRRHPERDGWGRGQCRVLASYGDSCAGPLARLAVTCRPRAH